MATRKPASYSGKRASGKAAAQKPSAHAVPHKPSHSAASAPAVNDPIFAEPGYMQDPTSYLVPTASDDEAYAELDQLIKTNPLQPLAFEPSRGGTEPILTLSAAYGSAGGTITQAIQSAGQIVFHSAGDTGSTSAALGIQDEYSVIDKMIADFDEKDPTAVPRFFYHLGDVVYSFGEHEFYYDQFYDAFRNYPAPIFAIPGNHDGLVAPVGNQFGPASSTLSAFKANFCAEQFQHSTDAVSLVRTTMIQPGAYFTLEAPFVRILGIYSNMLENPGVISSTVNPQTGQPTFPELSDIQLNYLKAALTRVQQQKFTGAVILAVHHPPYTFGKHIESIVMLKEIDAICEKVGVWPHAVFSGHAHNYQRYTRTLGKRQIPYIVCGNGGHPPLQKLSVDTTLRTPIPMPAFTQPERKDSVTLDNYDFNSFGYLRVIVDTTQLRIEYHPEGDGVTTKTPDDFVTVLLKNGTLVHYVPPTTPINQQI
jgi:Calcineurin-like phosphoesterase